MATTKQIRIRKNYYMSGYYSVHSAKYKNGKLVFERLIGYDKSKKKADLIKKQFLKRRKKR
jgi:hypothetical protein